MKITPTVKWVVFGFITIALGTVVTVTLKRQVAIDRCLDRGGSWNYDAGHCEGARPKSLKFPQRSMSETAARQGRNLGGAFCSVLGALAFDHAGVISGSE